MTEIEPLAKKVKGAIFLIDKNGNEKKTRIDKALKIVAPNGSETDPTLDASGDFSADLSQTGQYRLRAAFDSKEYVFAFNKNGAPHTMPQLDLNVQGGETDLKIYAWKVEKSEFGKDGKVDAQFAIDTAQGCIFLHDVLIAKGETEAKAWLAVQVVLQKAFSNPAIQPDVLCKTCRDRYYTSGTVYYMNYPAYSTCMTQPPCN